MARKPSSGRRGLGHEHRLLRAILPRPNGQACPFCGKPMWPTDNLDLDHKTPRALGGSGGPRRWAHAKCNRSAGGTLGNALRHGFGKIRSEEW